MLFEAASALDLPFDDGQFDVVLLQHVAMNISDRARLYREIRRVLKPGGKFATFDVVLNGEAEPHYPVPWARTPDTSFLLTPQRRAMRSNRPVSARSFGKTTPRPAKPGPRSCALRGHRRRQISASVMGPDLAPLATNLGRNLMEGRVGILTAVFEAASAKTGFTKTRFTWRTADDRRRFSRSITFRRAPLGAASCGSSRSRSSGSC